MGNPLRILIVEDEPAAAELVLTLLRRGGYEPISERVETASALRAALGSRAWDIVLCDYRLPAFSAPEALEILQVEMPDIPCIVFSGIVEEETAVDLLKKGAVDFVSKARLSRLVPAVERALHEAADRRERRKAEDALHRSEAKYRELVENLNDVIFEVDRDGRIAYVSPAVERVFGYVPTDLVGQHFSPLIHPDDLSSVQVALTDVLAGRLYPSEYRIRGKNGDFRWLRTSSRPSLAADGKAVGIHGVMTDITERKMAETALRESEERYRELFEHINCGVAVYEVIRNGEDFILRDFNRAGEETDHDKRERLIGKSIFEVRPGVEEFGLIEVFRQVWRTGEPAHHPVTLYRDGRLEGWYENFVYRLASGEIVAVFANVTERKRAEAEIREFSRRLIAVREEEKRRLSADLHHDVGSMTVGVSAYLRAAEEDLRAGKTKEALDALKECRGLFDESVRKLKGLAVQLRPPDLDVLGLAAALRQHFAGVTRNTSPQIYFTDASRGATIEPDIETVLFRVAQESVNNAIRHADVRRVRVRLSAGKPGIALTIADDGKGFDPAAVSARPEAGMGLRVMKEMATALGGDLTVESAPGKGTRVKVVFDN